MERRELFREGAHLVAVGGLRQDFASQGRHLRDSVHAAPRVRRASTQPATRAQFVQNGHICQGRYHGGMNAWALLRGMSLRELSRRSGVAEGLLSQIWAGKKGAGVETLLRLVDAGLPAEPLIRALAQAKRTGRKQRSVASVLDSFHRSGRASGGSGSGA